MFEEISNFIFLLLRYKSNRNRTYSGYDLYGSLTLPLRRDYPVTQNKYINTRSNKLSWFYINSN